MARPGVLGPCVIGVGAVIAYFHNDARGLLLSFICLIAGLTVIVISVSMRRGATAKSGARKQSQIMVQVKGQVHTYPQGSGQTHDPSVAQDFQVFMACWLVLASELSLKIAEVRLILKTADGRAKPGEWMSGDLKNWQLREEERVSTEGADWKKRNIDMGVRFTELDAATPLDCGAPRKGWLQFRIRDTSAAELSNGSLELSVKDSLSDVHTAGAIKLGQLPGKVFPISDKETV